MNSDCIFCKINEGEIPSTKVYEDDDFNVILDRYPASKGHMLILPKKHIKDIYDLDPKLAGKLFELATKLSCTIKETFNNEGLNVIQNNGKVAGQTVFHYHLHLIPRYKDDSVNLNWESDKSVTVEKLEKHKKLIQDKIKTA